MNSSRSLTRTCDLMAYGGKEVMFGSFKGCESNVNDAAKYQTARHVEL